MNILDIFKGNAKAATPAPRQMPQLSSIKKDYSLSGLFGQSAGAASFVASYNNTGQVVSEYTALTSSAVYACVKIIAETIAKLPVIITKANYKIVKDHLVTRLLQQPNPLMSYTEFMMYIAASLELTGNSIIYIERDLITGDPIMLVPIHPSSATWSWNQKDGTTGVGTGMPFYSIYHPLLGTKSQIPYRDIIHLKNFQVGWGYEGISPIAASQNVIGINLAQNHVVGNYYSQSAISTGVLKIDEDLSPEALASVSAGFKQRHTGTDAANEVLILQKGLDFQPITMNSKDAQLLESRQFSVTEIARIFGVPLSKLAFGEAKSVSNYEEESLSFVEDCIVFKCKRIAEAFTNKLLFSQEREAFNISFDYSELNKSDTATRFEKYQKGLSNGFFTVNEVRAMEGLPPSTDPEADKLHFPLNHAATDDPAPVNPGTQVDPKGGHNSDSPHV